MKSSNDAFYTHVRVYMLTYYITVLTCFYSFLRLIRDPFSCFLLVHLFPFVSLENFTWNEPIFSTLLLLIRKESISIGIFYQSNIKFNANFLKFKYIIRLSLHHHYVENVNILWKFEIFISLQLLLLKSF